MYISYREGEEKSTKDCNLRKLTYLPAKPKQMRPPITIVERSAGRTDGIFIGLIDLLVVAGNAEQLCNQKRSYIFQRTLGYANASRRGSNQVRGVGLTFFQRLSALLLRLQSGR